MKPATTLYRGLKLADGTVRVTRDGEEFLPHRPLPARPFVTGFGWGYAGTGAKQLAFSLVLDATGDWHLAAVSHTWIMWAVVFDWGDHWKVTAGDIRGWMKKFSKQARAQRRQFAALENLVAAWEKADAAPDAYAIVETPARTEPAPEMEGGGI